MVIEPYLGVGGSSNTLSGAKIYSNTGNGMLVAGPNNTVKGTDAIERR